MKLLLRLIAAVFTLTALPAFAAKPFARAVLDATGTVVPGQQVHLIVDVLAPGFFTSPPDFPLFDMPNALVTLPEGRAQNLVETVEGVQYSGIRKRYAIVPETAGTFSVPSISISFTYSADGTPTKATVTTTQTELDVVPAGVGNQLYSARDVAISQSFDRDPNTLKSGDALVRTIVVTAKETQAMLMPAVDAGYVSGLAIYIKPPKLEDGVSAGRGETLSRRTDTVVYTTDAAGSFTLPAISYPWFDLDTATETSAELPEVTVTVAASLARRGIVPELTPPFASHVEDRRAIALRIVAGLAIVLAFWALRHVPFMLAQRLRAVCHSILQSHWYQLRLLRKTILKKPALDVYAALQHWAASNGFATLQQRVEIDAELTREIKNLEALLFSGGGGDFDRKCLAQRIARLKSRETIFELSPFPPLNPSANTRVYARVT